MSIWWFCLADNSVIPEEFAVTWALPMYILCSFAVKKKPNKQKQTNKQTNKKEKEKERKKKQYKPYNSIKFESISWEVSHENWDIVDYIYIFYFYKWKFQTGYFGQNFDYFYQIT